ncbi:hypothetical protein EDC04DRAFT_2557545, partial [Pisolithus marmoratus]
LLIHALDALQQKAENEDVLKLLDKSLLSGGITVASTNLLSMCEFTICGPTIPLPSKQTNVREQNGAITVSTSYAHFEADGAQPAAFSIWMAGWKQRLTISLHRLGLNNEQYAKICNLTKKRLEDFGVSVQVPASDSGL